ncbi:MAG: HlyD family efflux transporter periplasmic adaptor subunit [bacterium]|nr:HlyD family efflux transporter periplasmic adaptor subunit [bacterium]
MDRPLPKVFWTRQRKTGLIFVLILLPLTIYTLFADLGTSKLRVDSNKLTISTVDRGPFQEFIPISGEVRPLRTVYIETVEGGRVEELYLEEGSMVAQGAAILRLTNTDLQLETMRREDQYLEQVNQLFNTRLQTEKQGRDFEKRLTELDYQILKSKRVYQRNDALREADLLSDLEYELSRDEYDFLVKQKELEIVAEEDNRLFREAQIEQLDQSVDRRKQNLRIAEENLDKLVIRAPIAGQLTSFDIEVGESAAMGERLGQIDATHGFRVLARIDQHYISRVDVGQSGEFELSKQKYPLRITKVYPDVMEGKFEVDLEFVDDLPRSIKRGQNLHIRLALGDLSEVIYVTNGAFFQKTGGQWAFVLNEDGYATRQDIRLGRQNSEAFEVLEGLEPGERVITSSYDGFEDYDQIVFRD